MCTVRVSSFVECCTQRDSNQRVLDFRSYAAVRVRVSSLGLGLGLGLVRLLNVARNGIRTNEHSIRVRVSSFVD